MDFKENNNLLKTSLNSNGILRILLDNPKNHNVLSEQIIKLIQSSLDDASINKNVRVIIISAEGPSFSAGHDLKELKAGRKNTDKGENYFIEIMTKCSKLMQSIVNNPKPVIAEVAGTATAAGCQLVASCDLAYAGKSARFATPGVNIGLFCSTPMVALSRNVTNKNSMEMLLTGELISSEKAEKIGLINKVVSSADLDSEVEMVCATINQKSAEVIAQGKRSFYRQIEMGLTDAYAATSQNMVKNLELNDANEGISSFLEKRQPEWTND